MPRWRFRLIYWVLLPAIVIATGLLTYSTWLTTSQFARLGEQTILHSTFLLVRDKVDQVEQQIIRTDNAVFDFLGAHAPEELQVEWDAVADERYPSVRSVWVLDDSGTVLGYASRQSSRARREHLKYFLERILPDLELERQAVGQLKHLHRAEGRTSRLVSYKALLHEGVRRYFVLEYDTDRILQNELPALFATEEGKRTYNIVDENNRRLYGPNLTNAGDYLVGHRFPTTLYGWRLQVAPKQGPLLDAKRRTRRISEVGLIAATSAVIVLGVMLLLYASDRERRMNALEGEFVANVSHELKTPLSVVRMFGEMLLTGRVKSDEKRREYVEIICRESERLTALIDNVLDFAALEGGKRTFQKTPTDLPALVQRAIDAFRNRYPQEGVSVELSVDGATEAVHVDEQAVVLAVINLLDNAAKYGAGTPIDVRVVDHVHEMEIAVRDHGPGIPDADLPRVFDRFFRAENSRGVRGSGIGLALVRRIAEAHGGRAWAARHPEGGAVVSIAIARTAPAARL